ncbi:MAG: TM2 domain-containing protein [Phycisphaerales bacterium]|nr:TM2 domain-containing protein [Phycisphaerales bacterium]
MITFPCPSCRVLVEAPQHLAGSTLGCPHCGNINTVPPHGGQDTLPPPCPRVAYILLAILVGNFGIHNFLAGYTSRGITQLLISVLLFWTVIAPLAVWIWAIVEACTVWRDARGRAMS